MDGSSQWPLVLTSSIKRGLVAMVTGAEKYHNVCWVFSRDLLKLQRYLLFPQVKRIVHYFPAKINSSLLFFLPFYLLTVFSSFFLLSLFVTFFLCIFLKCCIVSLFSFFPYLLILFFVFFNFLNPTFTPSYNCCYIMNVVRHVYTTCNVLRHSICHTNRWSDSSSRLVAMPSFHVRVLCCHLAPETKQIRYWP